MSKHQFQVQAKQYREANHFEQVNDCAELDFSLN